MFFDSADLSTNTNLRSIIIDALSIPSHNFEVDACFLRLLSMLFRTNLPCLETISFTLASNFYYPDFNKIPWTQLAQSVVAHSSSLRSLNIILRDIIPAWKHKMKQWEREIIENLSGVRLGEKPLLAITNISFLQ
jgi:hypothetical protein